MLAGLTCTPVRHSVPSHLVFDRQVVIRTGSGWGLSPLDLRPGWGFLFGRGRRHEGCVALDFQVATIQYRIVAQVGVIGGERVLPARVERCGGILRSE